MPKKKPLPQFNSLAEAKEFYEKYGRLEFFGRGGRMAEYCIYKYHVRDGRVLSLFIYNDGRVEDYEDVLKRMDRRPKNGKLWMIPSKWGAIFLSFGHFGHTVVTELFELRGHMIQKQGESMSVMDVLGLEITHNTRV